MNASHPSQCKNTNIRYCGVINDDHVYNNCTKKRPLETVESVKKFDPPSTTYPIGTHFLGGCSIQYI